ncbi:MAG: hypothetical protein K2M48_03585 [Clostridiales bacterium]|nr:hypothetical protein [Clostridiales bacterium]
MNAKTTTALKKIKQKAEQKLKTKKPTGVAHDKLELLFTIVNRSKAEFYVDLLEEYGINIQLVVPGKGTADASMLSLFGLTDSDKGGIIGVINENKIHDALDALDTKFQTVRNGKGIAYTVPLSGVIGTLIYRFLTNNKMAIKQNDAKSENGDKK